MVRVGVRRRARVGASADDIRAQQAAVTRESTNVAQAVSTCKALDATTVAAWYVLAAQCQAFVSTDAPILLGIDATYAQGQSLLSQLAAWRGSLAAAGCPVPTLQQVPAPPPASDPMTGSLGDLLRGGGTPLLILAALFLLSKGK